MSTDRFTGIYTLLEQAPLRPARTMLDIGVGDGRVAQWFLTRGLRVIGTGLAIHSYGLPTALRAQIGLSAGVAERLPFRDGAFDLILMSHVLEHCANVGLALQEVRRVLADDGQLVIFVPPHDDRVLAGHVAAGWNIGQLMYVLAVNQFDVRHGHFAHLAWNVCACAGKAMRPLPGLRGDQGDIRLLADDERFPLPVHTPDGANDSFWGVLGAVNWPGPLPRSLAPPVRLALSLLAVLPDPLKFRLGQLLCRMGNLLMRSGAVNPDALRL